MSTFGAGTFGSGTFGDPSPASAVPDGVNDTVDLDAPTGTFSPLIDALQDNFDTGTVPDPARWPTTAGPTYVTLTGGRLSITTPAGLALYNVCQSASIYTVTNSALVARVFAGAPSGNMSQQTFMSIDRDDSNFLSMTRNGANLGYELKEAGSSTFGTIATFDATAMAWWRIRHDGAAFRIGYSADGATWTETAGITPSWANTTTMRASLLVGKWDSSDAAITSTFDDVNLAPYGAAAPDDGVAHTLAPDDPTAAHDSPATPDGVDDPTALDDPTVAVADTTVEPDGVADDVAMDVPHIVIADTTALPDGVDDTIGLGDPVGAAVTTTAPDDGPALTVTGDAPTTVNTAEARPDGIAAPLTHDAPTGTAVTTTAPDAGPGHTVTGDNPTASYLYVPTGLAVTVAVDAVTVTQTAEPTGVTLAITGGDPPSTRGQVFPASGPAIKPVPGGGIAVTFTAPTPHDVGILTGVHANIVFGAPTVTFVASPPTHVLVGDGPAIKPIPGAGVTAHYAPDGELPAVTGVIRPAGIAVTIGHTPPSVDVPLYTSPTYDPIVAPRRTVNRVPFHQIGVGPWNAGITWKGAPNHGQATRVHTTSTPALGMPEATSKSFTLRLNEGEEARADFTWSREKAFVIEERSTDLWWRRRDPNRNIVEPIGRFNADNVDISMSEDGTVRVSATFVDYRALLEDRLILTTADVPTAGKSSWPKGALITDILRFVVPTNMGLDLTEITPGTESWVGTITEAIELPPGTTCGEAFANLLAISSKPLSEWWVEMPTENGARPRLRFSATGRGADKGVYLIDTGSGQSPIKSWTIQAAGQKYANAIYYQGGEGGVVYTLPDDIDRYGQRDAREQDTSLLGNLPLIQAAATKKLAELASQRITWTLNLRDGFWEGRSHIDVGDWLTCNIKLGGELITGTHRVTEITGDIDTTGTENISLTLGVPRPSKDPRSRFSAMARFVRSLKNYKTESTA